MSRAPARGWRTRSPKRLWCTPAGRAGAGRTGGGALAGASDGRVSSAASHWVNATPVEVTVATPNVEQFAADSELLPVKMIASAMIIMQVLVELLLLKSTIVCGM